MCSHANEMDSDVHEVVVGRRTAVGSVRAGEHMANV